MCPEPRALRIARYLKHIGVITTSGIAQSGYLIYRYAQFVISSIDYYLSPYKSNYILSTPNLIRFRGRWTLYDGTHSILGVCT